MNKIKYFIENIESRFNMRRVLNKSVDSLRQEAPNHLNGTSITPYRIIAVYSYKTSGSVVSSESLSNCIRDNGILRFNSRDDIAEWLLRAYNRPGRSFSRFPIDFAKLPEPKHPALVSTGDIILTQVIPSMFSIAFCMKTTEKYESRIKHVQSLNQWEESLIGNIFRERSYIRMHDPVMVRKIKYSEINRDIYAEIEKIMRYYRIEIGKRALVNNYIIDIEETVADRGDVLGVDTNYNAEILNYVEKCGMVDRHTTFQGRIALFSLNTNSEYHACDASLYLEKRCSDNPDPMTAIGDLPRSVVATTVIEECFREAKDLLQASNTLLVKLLQYSSSSKNLLREMRRLQQVLDNTMRTKLHIKHMTKDLSQYKDLLRQIGRPVAIFTRTTFDETISLSKYIERKAEFYSALGESEKLEEAEEAISNRIRISTIVSNRKTQIKLMIMTAVLLLVAMWQILSPELQLKIMQWISNIINFIVPYAS